MPGPMGRGPASERAKDFKGTIKKLVAYIAHERIALIIAIVCAIASVVFNVLGPAFWARPRLSSSRALLRRSRARAVSTSPRSATFWPGSCAST